MSNAFFFRTKGYSYPFTQNAFILFELKQIIPEALVQSRDFDLLPVLILTNLCYLINLYLFVLQAAMESTFVWPFHSFLYSFNAVLYNLNSIGENHEKEGWHLTLFRVQRHGSYLYIHVVVKNSSFLCSGNLFPFSLVM